MLALRAATPARLRSPQASARSTCAEPNPRSRPRRASQPRPTLPLADRHGGVSNPARPASYRRRKRTMGRKQNDVFVLGDESLTAEPIAPRDPAPLAATDAQEGGGSPPPSAGPTGLPTGAAMGARRLAVLGLGAAAAATLGALELSSGTGSAHSQGDRTSPRSALLARPAPSAPAPHAQPAPARPAGPKPRPRPDHRSVCGGRGSSTTASASANPAQKRRPSARPWRSPLPSHRRR